MEQQQKSRAEEFKSNIPDLMQISGGSSEYVFAVSSDNYLYRFNRTKGEWFKVGNNRFNDVSVGSDNSVFAIGHGNHLLFKFNSDRNDFERFVETGELELKQVSVGNENNIFGVSREGHYVVWWTRERPAQVGNLKVLQDGWFQLTRKAMHVVSAGGPDGKLLCAIGDDHRVMKFNFEHGIFQSVGENRGVLHFEDISVDANGNLYGITYKETAKSNDVMVYEWPVKEWRVVEDRVMHFDPITNITACSDEKYPIQLFGVHRDRTLWHHQD